MADYHVTAGRPYFDKVSSRSQARRNILWWPSSTAARARVARPAAETGSAPRLGAAGENPVPGRLVATRLSSLSRRHFQALAMLAFIGIMLILGLVRSNHQAVAYGYEISGLTQTRLKALESNRQLKMELAQVTSLDQLEAVAKTALGLVVPQQGQIVVIE